jgi:hypothetical protein
VAVGVQGWYILEACDVCPVLTHEKKIPHQSNDRGEGRENFVANGGGQCTGRYVIIGWDKIREDGDTFALMEPTLLDWGSSFYSG